MKNNNFKKWFTFFVLVLGGGTIFKLCSLKDAFYVPMQTFMHLTHTQIGMTMTVYGLVQTFGYIVSMYLSDRFSKKIMLPFSLIAVGITGFYFATFPSYKGILVVFALLAVFGENTYWPVLLKSIRLLGNADEQGRMFGFLEAGRGIVDTIVAFSALGVFALLGKGPGALKGAMIFYSVLPIVIGIISYFLLEDDKISDTDESGKKIGRDAVAFKGVIKALKMPEIWVASFTVFTVYCVYCGLTYFIPFLKDIYKMPVTLVGAYGIINQYGLKIIGGPFGGFMADKKVKSAAKYIRGAFVVAAIAMTGFIMLPHETMNIYLGMALTLGFGAIIFTMRAVFFAPIEEIKVPREISGTAMSIASFIGYAPSMFAYTLYGSMLDKNPGMAGYKHVFITMIGFAVVGIVISSLLVRIIKKKNARLSNAETVSK